MNLARLLRDWWQRLPWPWKVAPIGHNQPPKRRARQPRADMRSNSLSHYYLDNLLDDLRNYFQALALMRQCDPDAYAVYRKLGAQIVPSRANIFAPKSLPETWRDQETRPATGMLHFELDNKDPEMCALVFAHYTKVAPRGDVESTTDSIYECRMYYRHKKVANGKLLPLQFYVAVDDDAKVRQLRQRIAQSYPLPRSKFHRLRHRGRTTVIRSEWSFPQWLIDAENKHKWSTEDVFRAVAGSMTYASGDGLQVRVRQAGGLTTRFNISLLRTPYFFRDREKTVTVNGLTKPIFHIVRAHRRVHAGGHVTYVKTHFRGVRRFNWHHYTVVISMSGYHHIQLDEWTVPSHDLIEEPDAQGYDTDQMGTLLDRLMDGDMQKTGFNAEFDAASRKAGKEQT